MWQASWIPLASALTKSFQGLLVAQWIERLPDVWKAKGLFPFRDSDLFPHSSQVDKFTFHSWKIVQKVVKEMVKKVKKQASVFSDNSCCEWDK